MRGLRLNCTKAGQRNDHFAGGRNVKGFINYLLRERGIGPLRVWSGVLGWLLLRIVGVVGPGLGAMRTAVSRVVTILVGVSFRCARPRRILLVSRPVTDALEAGGIPNWRGRRWRSFVSLIKREREAVESEALAVSNGNRQTWRRGVKMTRARVALCESPCRNSTRDAMLALRGNNYACGRKIVYLSAPHPMNHS